MPTSAFAERVRAKAPSIFAIMLYALAMVTRVQEKAIVSAQVDAGVRDELMRRATEADRSLSAEVRRAAVFWIVVRPGNPLSPLLSLPSNS
jgi:hypothetical protein